MRSTQWLRMGALLLAALLMDSAACAPIALKGGTLVDLSDFGRGNHDVPDAVVMMDGDRIVAAGPASAVTVPAGAKIIDVTGKFIVPGLVDGFATQNNAGQAYAHLYMGVTTVIGSDGDGRRGSLAFIPDGPTVVNFSVLMGRDLSTAKGEFDDIGPLRANARALTPVQIVRSIDAKHWDGYGAVLLFYSLDLEHVRAASARARELGMLAIGELGHTRYLDAARAGVPIFVHENRYLLDLAPDELRAATADSPFGPARARYMEFLDQLDPADPKLIEYGRSLAAERVALMPALAILSNWLPDHANSWDEPVAKLIDARDIMLPPDRKTGAAPHFGTMTLEQEQRESTHMLELQKTLVRAGAKFVVGSGCDAFGVFPGLGAHIEMALLVRIGLTPRQALAAATNNFSSLVDTLQFGVLREGARADVLVLDADPTEDIRNVRRIGRLFVRGEEVDREGLLKRDIQQAPR